MRTLISCVKERYPEGKCIDDHWEFSYDDNCYVVYEINSQVVVFIQNGKFVFLKCTKKEIADFLDNTNRDVSTKIMNARLQTNSCKKLNY